MDTSECSVPPTVTRRLAIGSTLALLVAAGFTVWGEYASDHGGPRLVLEAVAGVLACALVPVALRRELPTALIMIALAVVSPAATPAATFAVILVAQRRPLRTAIGVGIAGVVAHAVQGVLQPPSTLTLAWWLILDVVAHAALVGIGAMLQARQALVGSLVLRARRAEEEQGRRVAEARAAERTKMAREMHDVLAHRLSLVATYAGALEYRPDSSPEQISRAAGVIRTGIQEALDELRDVIRVLRDDPGAGEADHPQPTAADLPRLLAESRSTGTGIRVEGALETLEALPAATGRTAYRLVQEGLTNARKHAPGEPVTVRIDGSGGPVAVIEIRNASRPGSPVVTGSGVGLLGMTERVRLAGGQLDHGLRDGQFYLRATLPWPH